MTTDHKNKFKFTLPIMKTRVKITKDDNGDDVEDRYISGVASNTSQDLVGDIMAPSAIKTMADSLQQHVIELNAEHDTSWRSELGEVVQLTVNENSDLVFEGKLNDMSTAEDLWKAITKYNKQLGVSIGGYIKEYDLEKSEGGDWVRVFKDIELDHIAITSSPANPKTWVNMIAKSIKDGDRALKELNKIDDEVASGEVTKEVVNERVELLLKSIQREDLKEDVINLIFIKDQNMAKKNTSLEAEEVKKDQTVPVASDTQEVEISAAPEDGDTADNAKEESKIDEPALTEEASEEVTEEFTEETPEEETVESDSKVEEIDKGTEDVVEDTEVKETGDTEKGAVEVTEETEDKLEEKSLSNAYTLVEVADYLSWAIYKLEAEGKDTTNLASALEDVKMVAAGELMEPEATKLEEVVVTEDSVDKAKKEVAEATSVESDEELMKSVDALTKAIEDKVAKKYEEETKLMIEKLQMQVQALSEEPTERRGVDVSKGVGNEVDGGAIETDMDTITKKMNEEIDEVKNTQQTSGQKFSDIQDIRRRYKDEYGIE